MSDDAKTPTPPSLLLLGGVSLAGVAADVPDRLLTQSKAVALLAYLLLSPRGAFQRRDRIVGLLWPEQDQHHARSQLRKTVHVIRSTLGEQVFVVRGDEDLAINHECLTSDAVALREAMERGRLAKAVELYEKGDLMPGFYLAECAAFEQWLEDQRKNLHELAINACLELAKLLEANASGTKAGQYARKAVRLGGHNERILRRCLILLDRLGDRAGALEVYDDFAKRLRVELNALPSEETQALAAALRSGRRIDTTPTPPGR